MKILLVTGYLQLNVQHRSAAEYANYGAKLFAAGLPTVAFLEPHSEIATPSNVRRLSATLQECWYRALISPATKNPVGDGDKKDTFDYYTVEHQKTTWIKQALEATKADVAIWVDFGIFHLGDIRSALLDMFKRVEARQPTKIVMPAIRPLLPGPIDCSRPQWFCAGGVVIVPREQADWFDTIAQKEARAVIEETGFATWEVNTWARIMQNHPEKFETYAANHDVSLFSNYGATKEFDANVARSPKIAVYSLAKNEEKHAAAWAESCKEADYRVVTDTGSTDRTPDILRAYGVSVHAGNVIPWRWDEAHNLSLHHVPNDADICVRLDLDERFKPGWREAIEKAWTPGTTKLRYMYTWSLTKEGKPERKFPADRVHGRSGYRWIGATHEGLVKWDGPETMGWSNELEIIHHRDVGKRHKTDLDLLQTATREMPHDSRMHWYLARQMDYENHPDTVATFQKYLDMSHGNTVERAYACRVLARRVPEKADYWYHRAIQEEPAAPEGYYELAKRAHEKKDHLAAYFWATQATARSTIMSHTTDLEATGHFPPDIAAVNAYLLNLFKESLYYTKIALERNPTSERLKSNVVQLEEQLKAQRSSS